MAHIWMSHGTHMNESCHTYEWAMSHIWMSHATHMNNECDTYERRMRLLQIWGSYDYLAPSNYTSLLQKSPIKETIFCTNDACDSYGYGVATVSRLLKITSLFCKRALNKRLYSAKETYNLKERTNHSHPRSHGTSTYNSRDTCEWFK